MRHAFALVFVACAAQQTATPIAVPAIEATQTTTVAPIARVDMTPPWALTASDGSGLLLRTVDAKAVVQGPLAFTELHLVFENTETRQREGTFQITLPPRTAISRFAMENSGKWMEAEVVPKMVARRAYDDFLHRRQDPALLEKAAGNQFRAKVFPIPANARKHLVISYSQELPGVRYVLPLRGLPPAEHVNVELAVTGADGKRITERLAETDWQADRDFVSTTATAAAAVGAGQLIAAQVELRAPATNGHDETRDVPRGITLLVDTSASRSLGFATYVKSIEKLAGELRAKYGTVEIVAFDQTTERMTSVDKLLERGAAGASNIGQALEWVGAHGVQPRIVIVSDGVVTAGPEGRDLEVVANKLTTVERIDVVLAGGLRDDRAAALLVRSNSHADKDASRDMRADALRDVADAPRDAHATAPRDVRDAPRAGNMTSPRDLPAAMPASPRDRSAATPTAVAARAGQVARRSGAVLDLDTDDVVAALAERVLTDIAINIPGATWWQPHSIPSARPGTKVMVFARMRVPISAMEVVGSGGVRQRLHVMQATAPLVERAIASAEIEEMEHDVARFKGSDAMLVRSEIAKRSVAARVLSRETSMLVLENDGDYARYGIDRKALADVLVVGTNGVERVHRADVTPIPTRIAKSNPSSGAQTDTVEPRVPDMPARARVVTTGPDNDRDAILDVEDRCPDQPETFNGMEDDDGCPDRGRVVLTSTAIMVLEPIHFTANTDVIERRSVEIADAVAATLQGAPDIALVEVQGHTDERGDDAKNIELSKRRAESVKQYLVSKGVAPERLVAQGYGETMPIAAGHDATSWAKNRRVDFLILRRNEDASASKAKLPPPTPAVTGTLAEIQQAIADKQLDVALAKAREWHAKEPGDVLALVGLGEALEARRDAKAARVYGSIIDLFPGRVDMRRFAGERLARVDNALAIDTFKRAVADRPDHMTGHRLLAYALVRANRYNEAFAAIAAGLDAQYRDDSYAGGKRVLGDDAAMIGAVYAKAMPAKRNEIERALAKYKLALATKPSTRFVAYWETDANDVDLHIEDAKGNHASYQNKKLASGGELYADVTTGYGPEAFVIDGTPSAGPYKLWLHYYAQGPMGYGMGALQIQTFDPDRGLTFDDRPYIIMTAHAHAELGTFTSPPGVTSSR